MRSLKLYNEQRKFIIRTKAKTRNIISEALREASKTRLLTALNQAKERLENHLFDINGISSSLESDCFSKYEKVGKTFYNSQIAATVRWLSSASSAQISDRLGRNATTIDSQSKQRMLENATTSALQRPADQEIPLIQEGEFKASIAELSRESAVNLSQEMILLPAIPSFSKFVNQKAKNQVRSTSNLSYGDPGHVQKRRVETEKLQNLQSDKKRKQK
ncbi:hypothetical protein HPP92_019117 [Vanilla planifolia]|uniref:Uncharacterized protein n=1 Tax=Vanilla planifolia TaxID=51239 RepID=A0A835QE94_VANPL|nr:hypothetical protein HPP92_019117 [Vanilla planifolia]